jgi:hypothetical protein
MSEMHVQCQFRIGTPEPLLGPGPQHVLAVRAQVRRVIDEPHQYGRTGGTRAGARSHDDPPAAARGACARPRAPYRCASGGARQCGAPGRACGLMHTGSRPATPARPAADRRRRRYRCRLPRGAVSAGRKARRCRQQDRGPAQSARPSRGAHAAIPSGRRLPDRRPPGRVLWPALEHVLGSVVGRAPGGLLGRWQDLRGRTGQCTASSAP